MIGQRTRGILFLVTIHVLFATGMLLAGIRAISPPDQPIWSYTQLLAGWPTWVVYGKANEIQRSESLSCRGLREQV